MSYHTNQISYLNELRINMNETVFWTIYEFKNNNNLKQTNIHHRKNTNGG